MLRGRERERERERERMGMTRASSPLTHPLPSPRYPSFILGCEVRSLLKNSVALLSPRTAHRQTGSETRGYRQPGDALEEFMHGRLSSPFTPTPSSSPPSLLSPAPDPLLPSRYVASPALHANLVCCLLTNVDVPFCMYVCMYVSLRVCVCVCVCVSKSMVPRLPSL